MVLYNGTDGPNWHYNQNWLTGAPLGEWEGITTDEDGRVVDMDLVCNRLSGEIPKELRRLASLPRLNLSDNQLSGMMPS